MIQSLKICLLILFIYEIILINANSYITSPITRGNQVAIKNGCVGPACLGPCEVPIASISSSVVIANVTRGQSLTIKWPRNGKAGGFVRFAWAPTPQSDVMKNFDTFVQTIVCFELNCGPADPSNANGGDSGSSDGSVLPCLFGLNVPTFLTDGPWTLQWAYFGGAFVSGDYYSCVDYNVLGGVNVTSKQKAFFEGGDFSNPVNRTACKYFNTNELHVCVDEPCIKTKTPGQNNGAPGLIETPPKGEKACNVNSDCKTNICKLDGYCKNPASLLTKGAVAAIVFAVFLLVFAGLIVIFFIVNKKEVPYMVPFKGRL